MIDIQTILAEINKHIAILNDDYTSLSTSVAILTERVEWLCKFFWLIAGITVTTVITNFYQIAMMINKKNGKDKNGSTSA